MQKQKLEIECPVCDAILSIDARSCPKCGADLGMADFQDLENLANDISNGSTSFDSPPQKEAPKKSDEGPETSEEKVVRSSVEEPKPEKEESEPKVEPTSNEEPKEKGKEDEEPNDKGKKKGLFSKFFGKKK
ncbi:MAG: zinc ribbon domain-containing protein [Methanomassiliicoccales archaeon]|jgi:hypothetical protein